MNPSEITIAFRCCILGTENLNNGVCNQSDCNDSKDEFDRILNLNFVDNFSIGHWDSPGSGL